MDRTTCTCAFVGRGASFGANVSKRGSVWRRLDKQLP
jgi:hypothetical protein